MRMMLAKHTLVLTTLSATNWTSFCASNADGRGRHIQTTQEENARQCNPLRDGHVQAPDHRQGQHQDHDVRQEVRDGVAPEGPLPVDAMATGYFLVPVEGDWRTLEDCREEYGQTPGDDDAAGDVERISKLAAREDAPVKEKDGQLDDGNQERI